MEGLERYRGKRKQSLAGERTEEKPDGKQIVTVLGRKNEKKSGGGVGRRAGWVEPNAAPKQASRLHGTEAFFPRQGPFCTLFGERRCVSSRRALAQQSRRAVKSALPRSGEPSSACVGGAQVSCSEWA